MIDLSDADVGDTSCSALFLHTIKKNLRRTDSFMYKRYLTLFNHEVAGDARLWPILMSEVLQKFDSNQGIALGAKTDQFADVSQGETIYGNLSRYYVPCIFRQEKISAIIANALKILSMWDID